LFSPRSCIRRWRCGGNRYAATWRRASTPSRRAEYTSESGVRIADTCRFSRRSSNRLQF
jgi:hypothetical protein